MTFRHFLKNLLPFTKKESQPSPKVVESDREALKRRAMVLWATDRDSAEAQEVFRILENSRTPTRHRASLVRVV